VSPIRYGSDKAFRVVYSIGLLGLVILGGLGTHPAHFASVVPGQSLTSLLSGGEHPYHYKLGNVALGPSGADPSSIVFDPQTGNVYVTVLPSLIKVISTRNDSVVATIDVGAPLLGGPEGMALDSAKGDVLIATDNGTTAVLSPSNNTVIRELPVGPTQLLYDPSTNRVLAADRDGITILNGTTFARLNRIPVGFTAALAYDPATREIDDVGYEPLVATEWDVEAFYDSNYSVAWSANLLDWGNLGGPAQIAYDGLNGDLYIPSGFPAPPGDIGSTNLSNFVLVLNATSGTIVSSVPVGASPEAAAYDSLTATVFVTNSRSDNISVIQGTTLRFASIPVGGYPDGVTCATGAGDVFVANEDSDTVSVLNDSTGHVVATVVLGGAPDSIAYDSGTSTIFAAGGGSMAAISDSNHTPTGITSVGPYPEAVAYDSRTGNLYVANSDNNSVSVVSGTTHQVLTTVNVGSYPDGVAYDDRSGAILVACANANAVDVISEATNSITATAYLGERGAYPTGVVYDPTTNDAYVSDQYALSVISGATWQVIATLTSFSYSFVLFGYLALDSANGNLYIPSYFGGVEVVSTATDSLVANITFVNGGNWYAAAFDAATGDVFVTNLRGNNVSVIDGADDAVIENLTVGDYPTGIGYDNRTGEIYVANEYSDSLTYIVATTPPASPLGGVFWVVLGATITFGIVGVMLAVWIPQRSAHAEVS
jgi:YVTN family beta-propeller protein